MEITIKTDGSCLNNGMPDATAGWAVVITGDIEKTLAGKLPGDKQTNNRAELFAVLKAMEWLKENKEAKASIYSDSKIAIDGLLGTSQRKANRDIWEAIESIVPSIHAQLVNVDHIDRDNNKDADEAAKRAANALIIL